MSSDTRPSAKIYQFPRKPVPRASAGGQEALVGRMSQAPRIEFGGGWYHEAAVQADRPRKS
jgi:hypothetical protein